LGGWGKGVSKKTFYIKFQKKNFMRFCKKKKLLQKFFTPPSPLPPFPKIEIKKKNQKLIKLFLGLVLIGLRDC